MGLLTTLVGLPFRAPVGGPMWVARRLAEAVDRERNDPAAIREALRDAEMRLLAGDLSEADYDAIEDDLLARLGGAGR